MIAESEAKSIEKKFDGDDEKKEEVEVEEEKAVEAVDLSANAPTGTVASAPPSAPTVVENVKVLDGEDGASAAASAPPAISPSAPTLKEQEGETDEIKSDLPVTDAVVVDQNPYNPYQNQNQNQNQNQGQIQNDAKTEEAKVTVVPGSVLAQLPPAIPEAQIISNYQQAGMSPELLQNPEFAAATTVVAEVVPGDWFTTDELAVLNQQPAPLAVKLDESGNFLGGNQTPPAPIEGADTPVLEPSGGAMPIYLNAFSPAVLKRDTMKSGYKSSDPCLDSREAILKFFQYHNTPPEFYMYVEGYHTEHYTTTDANGKTTTRSRHVTDFTYNLPLTQFIYPYGKIMTQDSDQTVVEMVDEFLASKNKLRSLQMKKKVYWNKKALESLVHQYIRHLGWNRGLTTTCRTTDKSIRIYEKNALASSWDHTAGRTMMIITVLPAIATALYGCKARQRGMRSIFTVQYSPLQVFEALRPNIWCPQQRMGCTIS